MTTLPDELRADVETLWDYHHLHHELRPTDVGIGLGSHDLGVATYAAELYHAGTDHREVPAVTSLGHCGLVSSAHRVRLSGYAIRRSVTPGASRYLWPPPRVWSYGGSEAVDLTHDTQDDLLVFE